MKVLIYTRPKSEVFFRNVVNEIFEKPQIITYSDYNRIADVWAGKYIYNAQNDFDNEEFERLKDDILLRCRTLRKMKPELAYKLTRRYWNGIESFFLENCFDYLFTVPIDCYTLDIICRIAEKYGVHIISISGSVFEGHAKLTFRGEYTKVREEVPENDINKFLEKMTKVNYLSPSEIRNVQKTHSSIYYWHFRRMLIEYAYYPLRKFIDSDPWNYHYNIYEVKGIPLRKRFNNEFETKFKHIHEFTFEKAKTVYYPMHFVPEATTDYWIPDVRAANYEQFVLDMINTADPEITFIIKEHPAMYGGRLLSFYDQLNSIPNVILVHPMDRSNNLLLYVDNVVVDNGTVGIEALMRGKRVICLSENYYRKFHPNAFMRKALKLEDLHLPLVEYDNRLFMKSMLQGVFTSDFKNCRGGAANSNYKQAAAGIKKYLEISNLPF